MPPTRWAADRARSNLGPDPDRALHLPRRGPFDLATIPTAYRAAGAGAEWPLGDPIERLKQHLIALGEWDEERHEALDDELDDEVRAAQKEAEKHGILGHGLLHQPSTRCSRTCSRSCPGT